MRINYSQWWDDMVAIMRANASILIALAGAFILLPAIAANFFTTPFQPLADGATSAETLERYIAYYRANIGPQLFLLLFNTLGQLLAYTVLLDPRRPSVGDAFRLAAPLFLPLIVANILVNLMLGAGLLLLVIPFLYLIGRVMLAAPALVAERRSNPLAAIGRSFALTKGNGWRIFFFAFLIFVVALVVQLAVNGTLGTAIGLLPGADDRASLRNLLLAVLAALFAGIFFVLSTALWVALYRRVSEPSAAADAGTRAI